MESKVKIVVDSSELKELAVQFKEVAEGVAKGFDKSSKESATEIEKVIKAEKELITLSVKHSAEKQKELQQVSKLATSFETLNKSAKLDGLNTTSKKAQESLSMLVNSMNALQDAGLSIDVSKMDLLGKELEGVTDDVQALNIVLDFLDKNIDEIGQNDIGVNLRSEIANIREQFNGLGVEATETKEKFDIMDDTFIANASSIREVSRMMKQAQVDLLKMKLAGAENTEEYQKLKLRLGELQDTLGDVNQEIGQAGSDTRGIDHALRVATTLTAGFTALQGATALFGDESEEMQKTLVKLNGAMAVLQGLQQIQEELSKRDSILLKGRVILTNLWSASLTGASRVMSLFGIAMNSTSTFANGLKVALASTGIGLLVVGVGLLVANFDKLKDAISNTSVGAKNIAEVNKRVFDTAGEGIAKMQQLNDVVKRGAVNVTEKKSAVDNYNKSFGEMFGKVSSYAELENKLIKNGGNYINYLNSKAKAESIYGLIIELTTKQLKLQTQSIEESMGFSDKAANFIGGNIAKLGGGFSTFGKTIQAGARVSAEETKRQTQATTETQITNLKSMLISAQKELEVSSKKISFSSNENQKSSNKATVTAEKKKNIELLDIQKELTEKSKKINIELLEDEFEKRKQNAKLLLDQEKEQLVEKIKGQLKGNDDLTKEQKNKISNDLKLVEDYYSISGDGYKAYNQELLKIDEDKAKAKLDILTKYNDLVLNQNKEQEQKEIDAVKSKYEDVLKEIKSSLVLNAEEKAKFEIELELAKNNELKNITSDYENQRISEQESTIEDIVNLAFAGAKGETEIEKQKQELLLQLQKDYAQKRLDNLLENATAEQKAVVDRLKEIDESTSLTDIVGIEADIKKLFGDEIGSKIIEEITILRTNISKTKGGQKTSFFELLGIDSDQAKGLDKLKDELSNFLDEAYDLINEDYKRKIEASKERQDNIQAEIDKVNEQIDAEKEAKKEGRANNLDLKEKEKADLEKQKESEIKEEQKTLERQRKLAKEKLAIDTALQASQLAVAIANIIADSTAKSGILAPAVAIPIIALMVGSFALGKVKALNAINSAKSFRQGIGSGKIELRGNNTHEAGGYSLIDNRTGEAKATYEDDEDIYALNRSQRNKYGHIFEGVMAIERGLKSPYLSSKQIKENRERLTIHNIRSNEMNKTERLLESIFETLSNDEKQTTINGKNAIVSKNKIVVYNG